MLSFHLTLSNKQRKNLNEGLKAAERAGKVSWCKRYMAILALDQREATIEQVAHTLQVAAVTVLSWVKQFLLCGADGLMPATSPGRPPKLTDQQRKELADMIDRGPADVGFVGNCWRSPMIRQLILTLYAVSYSVKYIPELLDELGFSFQKGRFASDHLDEERRKEWLEKTFPQILKLAREKNARIWFEDEASFPQWGSLGYTWARKGQQPTIETCGKRKGYKVLGMIDYMSGMFLYKGQEERFTSATYQAYLEECLRRTDEHMILLQDGARYHTSKAMRAFYEKNKDRLTVFQLPSYSPDYNPIEKLWKKIKEKGTHLQYFPAFEDLKAKVNESLLQFDNAPEEIISLFAMYDELSDAA